MVRVQYTATCMYTNQLKLMDACCDVAEHSSSCALEYRVHTIHCLSLKRVSSS